MVARLRTTLDAAGAAWCEWNGNPWVSHFGDPTGEHQAVRRAAGVWDISALYKWEVDGAGSVAAVDRLFSNDVLGATTGTIRYGLFCDEDGVVVNDATVYKLSDEHIWVISSMASDGDHLARWLDLQDITDRLAALQVQGPESREMLTRLGPDLSELAYFGLLPQRVAVAGVVCWVSRVGYSGELGYELFCSPGDAPHLWRELRRQAARPYGLAAVHTLRIEAGLLMVGNEFHPGHTCAADLGLEAVLRLERDFLGSEALRRRMRQSRRKISTLSVIGEIVPAARDVVICDERTVGAVTSACHSPTLGGVMALASVNGEAVSAGAQVMIDSEAGALSATIVSTPVYDPAKRRRRA